MSNSIKFTAYQQELRVTFERAFLDLVVLRKDDDKSAFNNLVLSIMPDIKKYINGRLSAAIHQGHFSKGKYKADDFADQLFIEIYDNLDEVKDKNDFYKWLFKKTNQLLDDTIVEEEFDDLFFKNIDDYSKSEWAGMVEKYTTDDGGEYIMMEELNDPSNLQTKPLLSPFFVENEEEKVVEKIDKELKAEEVHNHINFVLASLPLSMRNVYDLYYSAQFSIDEIAEITDMAPDDVDDLIKEAKIQIKRSFEKRF